MNTSRLTNSSWNLFKKFGLFTAAMLFAAPLSSLAQVGPAPGGPVNVKYNPAVQTIQLGDVRTAVYNLRVSPPDGVSLATPFNVNLVLSVDNAPGNSAAALTYVTGYQATLTFDSAHVTFLIPIIVTMPAIVGSGSLDYKYHFSTSGWPTGNYTVVDGFSYINVHQDPPSAPPPPSITIDSPADQSVYTYVTGGADVMVPIRVSSLANDSAVILTLDATISGPNLPSTPLGLIYTGLGTAASSGVVDGGFPVNTPGIYTIIANTTSATGASTTSSKFYVNTVLGPTVVIDQPPAATWTYYVGDPALSIPFSFLGHSNSSVITQLTARINDSAVAFTTAGLNTPDARGTGVFQIMPTISGAYTLVVNASDIYGTPQDVATFTINVVGPRPVIVINTPSNGSNFPHNSGTPELDIPFTFTTNSEVNYFKITGVSAVLDPAGANVALDVSNTSGLNTVMAVTTGTMRGVVAGVHTLVATGASAGVVVTTSVTFTVQEKIIAQATPPTVLISSPAEGASFTMSGSSLAIPMTFTGRSTTPGAVVTGMTASLDGVALSWAKPSTSVNALGTSVADGLSSMVVSTAGVHTIDVTATDTTNQMAKDRHTFTVYPASTTGSVTGTVFFDVNFNGLRNTEDYGLGGATVKLQTLAGGVVASTTSSSTGTYVFANVAVGNYIVAVSSTTGLSATTLTENQVALTGGTKAAPAVGFGLNFCAIKTLCANGFTIGYWKNNIDKAIANKTAGTQVSSANLATYTNTISTLALAPFNGNSMAANSGIMGSTSSASIDLLSKQLVASEYNYASAGYIGGNATLTYAFIYWGEYIVANPSKYTSSYVTFAQQWFDAYNNSHGGLVLGPNP